MMLFSSEGGGGSGYSDNTASTTPITSHWRLFNKVIGTPPILYYPASITLSQQPMSKYPDISTASVATYVITNNDSVDSLASAVGTTGAMSVKDGLDAHRFSDTDALHPASKSLLCRSNLKHPKEDTK